MTPLPMGRTDHLKLFFQVVAAFLFAGGVFLFAQGMALRSDGLGFADVVVSGIMIGMSIIAAAMAVLEAQSDSSTD